MQTNNGKQKVRSNNGTQVGVYKVDSIKVGYYVYPSWVKELRNTQDIAESLNIAISDNVASSLASDVEYRINQVIEVKQLQSWIMLKLNNSRKQRDSCDTDGGQQ